MERQIPREYLILSGLIMGLMAFIGLSFLPIMVWYGNRDTPENHIYTLQVFYFYLIICTSSTIAFIILNFYQEKWARERGMIFSRFREMAVGKGHCINCKGLIRVMGSLKNCPHCGYKFG